MERLDHDTGSIMHWSQPHAARTEYELRSRTALLATLTVNNMFGTLATARSADGCWTFKRIGFWQNRANIRACGSDTDVAIFTNNTWDGGGTLEFLQGPAFKASTNFWKTSFAFTTDTGEPLIAFDFGGVFHRSSDVHLSPLAAQIPETPLLVLFGWYLILMLSEDHGAGAVVVNM
jgi:hypothetical protein